MFAAFFVLGIIACIVVFGIMLGKRQQGVGSSGAESESAAAKASGPVDPFEGMTYSDENRGRNAPGPFAGVKDFESDAELWVRARDAYAQAEALIDESSKLHAEGDVSWRDLSAEAKSLCAEALQRAAVWRDALVADVGEGSAEVTRLDKTLQKWRRTSMMLHKTVSR